MIHRSDLTIRPGDTADYSALTQVTGGLDVREGATLDAPLLRRDGKEG